MALAARARRFLVKTRQGIVRVDAAAGPLSRSDVATYLVHGDGFLNVPVLLRGDLLVRGFTDDLYREALEKSPHQSG